MIASLKKMLGFGTPTNYAELVKSGAIIVDVRSKEEFAGGHIKGAINIAVDQINKHLSKFPNKNQVIITCCASGMRSGVAKSTLSANGYTQVYNGGSWRSLQNKL